MECLTCHNCLPEGAVFCPRCGAQCAEAAEPADYRYAAFISYRHIPRDAEVAKRVQRFIETFRLPRGIAQNPSFEEPRQHADVNFSAASHDTHNKSDANHRNFASSSWPIPGKPLGKCFRDEDELAASHSLPESIQTALAQSRWLVIICSPEALESTWIQREIETFAQLHGRERILCVLAEGSSAESVPPLLKNRLLPDTSGALHEMPASPLAADLRNGSNTSQTAELLRVVAAIAGVGYDALRQRERARRHRKIAAAVASAAAVLALVGTFAALAHNASQTALIEESKSLAAKALDQYERGEHLQAIETALAALPSSESDHSRPLVPEAQAALEKLVSFSPDPDHPWQPMYCVDVESEIVDFAYDMEGEWLAILDSSGTISLFDAYTSQPKGTYSPSIFSGKDAGNPELCWMMKAVSPNALIVSNSANGGDVICFDPISGKELWSIPLIAAFAASASSNPEDCWLFYLFSDQVAAGLVDLKSGKMLGQESIARAPLPNPTDNSAFCADDETGSAYAGFGNALFAFDLADGFAERVTVQDSVLRSLKTHNGILVACADEINGEKYDVTKVPFSVRTYNASALETGPLWSHESTFSNTVDVIDGDDYPYVGSPEIQAILPGDPSSALVSAGTDLLLFGLEGGDLLYSHSFSTSVVAATPFYSNSGRESFAVVLSDGTITVVSPETNLVSNGNFFTSTIPYAIERASISAYYDLTPVAFIQPANQPNRLLYYRFSPAVDKSEESFTFNELIAYAHSALEFS